MQHLTDLQCVLVGVLSLRLGMSMISWHFGAAEQALLYLS